MFRFSHPHPPVPMGWSYASPTPVRRRLAASSCCSSPLGPAQAGVGGFEKLTRNSNALYARMDVHTMGSSMLVCTP